MWLTTQIPKPTFVPTATEPENISPELSEPVNPVSFAPLPGSSSGKGETPLGIPPGSGSFPLRGSVPPPPIIDYRYRDSGYSPPAPPVRIDPIPLAGQQMGLSFGGIIQGAAKFIDNKLLGGAIQTIGGLLDKPAAQKVLNSGPRIGISLPGSPPMLPSIGGGIVKQGPTGIFSDVRGGGSSTAPRGGRRYRRMNPMNVKALRRAARRLESGEKLFRKVFSLTHPGHGQQTVKIKRRKRA